MPGLNSINKQVHDRYCELKRYKKESHCYHRCSFCASIAESILLCWCFNKESDHYNHMFTVNHEICPTVSKLPKMPGNTKNQTVMKPKKQINPTRLQHVHKDYLFR